MTKQVTLGAVAADHGNQVTHVDVEIWDLVADGIRRRLDKFEMTFGGATVETAILKPAVHAQLLAAGIIGADDAVLTQAEARTP